MKRIGRLTVLLLFLFYPEILFSEKVPKLTADELSEIQAAPARLSFALQRRALVLAKQGDRQAVDILVRSLEGYLWTLASKTLAGQGIGAADLYQEGTIGVLIAIEKFDLNRPVEFITYAGDCAFGYMRRAIQAKASPFQLSISLMSLYAKMKKVEANYRVEHGHPPSDETLAALVGCSVNRLATARTHRKLQTSRRRSLTGGDREPLDYLTPDKEERVEPEEERNGWSRLIELVETLERKPQIFLRLHLGLGIVLSPLFNERRANDYVGTNSLKASEIQASLASIARERFPELQDQKGVPQANQEEELMGFENLALAAAFLPNDFYFFPNCFLELSIQEHERLMHVMRTALNELPTEQGTWLRLRFGLDGFSPIEALALSDIHPISGSVEEFEQRAIERFAENVLKIDASQVALFSNHLQLADNFESKILPVIENYNNRLGKEESGSQTANDLFHLLMFERNSKLRLRGQRKILSFLNDQNMETLLTPNGMHSMEKRRAMHIFAILCSLTKSEKGNLVFEQEDALALIRSTEPFEEYAPENLSPEMNYIFRHRRFGALAYLSEVAIHFAEGISTPNAAKKMVLALANAIPDSAGIEEKQTLIRELESEAWGWRPFDGMGWKYNPPSALRLQKALFRITRLTARVSGNVRKNGRQWYRWAGAKELIEFLYPEVIQHLTRYYRLSQKELSIFADENAGGLEVFVNFYRSLGLSSFAGPYAMRTAVVNLISTIPSSVGGNDQHNLIKEIMSEAWGWFPSDDLGSPASPQQAGAVRRTYEGLYRMAKLLKKVDPSINEEKLYLKEEMEKVLAALCKVVPRLRMQTQSEITEAQILEFCNDKTGGRKVFHALLARFGLSNFQKSFFLKNAMISLVKRLPRTAGATDRDALILALETVWKWNAEDWAVFNLQGDEHRTRHHLVIKKILAALLQTATLLERVQRGYSLANLFQETGLQRFFGGVNLPV